MELDAHVAGVAAREIKQWDIKWTYEREGGTGIELAVLHMGDGRFLTFGIDALVEALTALRDSKRDQANRERQDQKRFEDLLVATVRDSIAPSLRDDQDPQEVAEFVVAASRKVGQVIG